MPAGRPKKPEGTKADTVFQIRLMKAQKEAYEAAAERAGLSLAEWLKALADKAAKKSAKPT